MSEKNDVVPTSITVRVLFIDQYPGLFYLPEGVLSIIDQKTNPLSKVPYASPIFANILLTN